MPGMRFHFSIAQAACFFSVWSCAAAAAEFPYEAYVIVDGAEIVAGPGHRFYATDRLSRGTKVEIYREEASGWLAIRPPDGSFSWVPADFVERLEDDKLGRVKQPTGAWVGTAVEQVAEHHQQLTLKAGELVQIIDEKTAVGNDGNERTWLKITPPAGEYRWVHLRDVVRQKPAEPEPPAQLTGDEDQDTLTPDPTTSSRVPISQRERERSDSTAKFDRSVEPAQIRDTARSGSVKTLSPDGFVPRKRRDNEASASPSLEPATRLATTVPRTSLTTPASNDLGRTRLRGDEISRQLDE